jgi:hypothetical protein
VRGNETEIETTSSDFRDVQRLILPFSIDTGQVGSPQQQKITMEKVEINPDLSDGQFHMPAPLPAEPPKPKAKPAEKPGASQPLAGAEK